MWSFYRHNPNVVAQASKNVLNEYLYAFKNIEFAVYCSPSDDTNYRIFDRVFTTVYKIRRDGYNSVCGKTGENGCIM